MSRGLQIALIASVLLLALGVGGIGAYLFLFQPAPAAASTETHTEEEKTEAAHVEEGHYFTTKNFVTDLADKDRLRYVDLTIALGMKDEAALEAAKGIEPQIRDLVLHQLRQQKAADFAGAEGKTRLAETLQTGLGEVLKGYLTRVYVTDLVVQ
ncbi:MAG: fliL [Symbiobacteriaceae bacterium]|jgi:flagellar basal body-associated protein FliL|nr:fliL [Symbiobacteriaceae bacterium]